MLWIKIVNIHENLYDCLQIKDWWCVRWEQVLNLKRSFLGQHAVQLSNWQWIDSFFSHLSLQNGKLQNLSCMFQTSFDDCIPGIEVVKSLFVSSSHRNFCNYNGLFCNRIFGSYHNVYVACFWRFVFLEVDDISISVEDTDDLLDENGWRDFEMVRS